jgi:hypothetical protein
MHKKCRQKSRSHSRSLDDQILPIIEPPSTASGSVSGNKFHIIRDVNGTERTSIDKKRENENYSMGESFRADTMDRDMRKDDFFEKDSMLEIDD